MQLANLLLKLAQLGDDALRLKSEAQQFAKLAKGDADRHTIKKTHQNRPRQKISQSTQFEHASENAEQPSKQRQQGRQGDIGLRISTGHGRYRKGDQRTGGCVRADDQLP